MSSVQNLISLLLFVGVVYGIYRLYKKDKAKKKAASTSSGGGGVTTPSDQNSV